VAAAVAATAAAAAAAAAAAVAAAAAAVVAAAAAAAAEQLQLQLLRHRVPSRTSSPRGDTDQAVALTLRATTLGFAPRSSKLRCLCTKVNFPR
jgi:hypothetical protein